MGLTRFLVPRREHLPAKAAERAYLAGLDDIPWRTRVTSADDGLVAERTESESGSFHILWNVAGRGELLLATATLIEREEQYNLSVELARGVVNRLKSNVVAWEQAALEVPPRVAADTNRAMAEFVAAVAALERPVEAADRAQRAIEAALDAGDALIAAFGDEAARVRAAQSVKQTILFGGDLDSILPAPALSEAFAVAFNTAVVRMPWGHVEAQEGTRRWSMVDGQIAWCQAHQMRIFAGPLLEIEQSSLPDWLYLWEGNFDNILTMASNQIRAAVSRYKGRVHLWNCAARVNNVETLSLSEEQSLRLTLRSIEIVRELDSRVPVVVSFNQPCGEYLARREQDLSPLQYADTLVRADLGIAGIGLEINLGSGPRLTLPRDVLEIGRQLERWTTLGLPLVILLTIPGTGDGFTPKIQQRWLESYLQLFSAKSAVHAVFWNQMRDEPATGSDSRGLIDEFAHPNATLGTLAAFRKRMDF
ncbi:MAG TPA: endo-1,4-beta-xylanase [Pirellulales bacterium]|jgi:hypothetical protein|nr:endo-1,4-beta-xylanase [Pirellulales bacterium]